MGSVIKGESKQIERVALKGDCYRVALADPLLPTDLALYATVGDLNGAI